jgi:hypothetical protein
MAQYSSAHVVLSIKDTGGTPRVCTAYVRSIGSVSIEAIIQESTAFGMTWATYVSTSIKKMAALVLGGFYDTAADVGPDVLFAGHEGETRTGCILTYGGAKTTTFDAIIQKYERLPKLGAMTEYQVTLQPTGTVTEA